MVKQIMIIAKTRLFHQDLRLLFQCIAFDSTHRRLIVGCRDGTSKIYNHNNGGLLKILKPRKLGREVSVVKQVQGPVFKLVQKLDLSNLECIF